MKFTVDAASITDYQTCKRRFLINTEWRLARYRPKILFDLLLRRGIIQLSKAKDVAQVASEAKSMFLLRAADPGLDIIGKDPYQASKGWTSLLESVLHGLSRNPLPVLHDPDPVKLTPGVDWRFLSWADDAGTLHRWVTVESWDTDTLSRELHSWRTFGDLVMSGCPMVLHAIVLGQNRGGRFFSPWTRCYAHPAMHQIHWKWVKPEDTNWKPIQLVDQNRLDTSEWVEEAWNQGAIQPLLQDQEVILPPESFCLDTKAQLAREAEAMRKLLESSSYLAQPMSRAACDLYSPCHFQNICHQPEPVQIDSLGLYIPRITEYSSTSSKVETSV